MISTKIHKNKVSFTRHPNLKISKKWLSSCALDTDILPEALGLHVAHSLSVCLPVCLPVYIRPILSVRIYIYMHGEICIYLYKHAHIDVGILKDTNIHIYIYIHI